MTTIMLLLLKVSGEPFRTRSFVSFNQRAPRKGLLPLKKQAEAIQNHRIIWPHLFLPGFLARVSQWSWALFMPSLMTALEHSRKL